MYPEPPLSDDTVSLRPWSEADGNCIEEASLDPYVCDGFHVPSNGQLQLWLAQESSWVEDGKGISLAITDRRSGEALGGALLMLRAELGNAGIAYWVLARARRRGLASRAVALVGQWALTDAGLARVEALVEPANTASQRVVETVGFHREGVLRSHRVSGDHRSDMVSYSLITSDLG